MKILILTCNTGGGHNAVSSALQACFAARGVACDVADGVSFLSASASTLLGRMHTGIYRYLPRAFGKGYRMAEEHPKMWQRNTPVWHALTAGSDKLYRHLQSGAYDAVICAHAFPALMMTALKQEHPDTTPVTCFIATDYTCSPTVSESDMDIYVIPDDSLAEEFVGCGIARERLLGAGIPVRGEFLTRRDNLSAKAACGLPTEGKHLLMMCGSMGCGPMEKITEQFARAARDDLTVSILCGTNSVLRKKLEKKYANHPRLRVYGYVDDVALLMDSADLYLTKPGGISVTESMAKLLPMVFVDAVAGCEEYNLRYFVERGMACVENTPRAIAARCLALLDDQQARARMAERMESSRHIDAAERICDALLAADGERGDALCGNK